MKKVVFLTVLYFFINNVNIFAQSNLNVEYKKFKSFFPEYLTSSSERYLNEIPKILSEKILGKDLINSHVVSIYGVALFSTELNTTMIIELGYPEGGYTSDYYLVTMSHDHRIENSERIGYNMLDGGGGIGCDLNIFNDSIIELKIENIEYDSNGNEVKVEGLSDGTNIAVKESNKENGQIMAHEMGHNLGMGHTSGLMQKEVGGTNLSKKSVVETLGHSGVGKGVKNSKTNAELKNKTIVGTAPKNFQNGKITKNKDWEEIRF